MRIAEIFQSVQGEGRLTGVDSAFVRVSGCNLRCSFCDTPYTSWHPEGIDLSVEQILEQVRRFQVQHVVLTGGEPMLFEDLVPLSAQLHATGWHITVETAGTCYLPVECQLMSVSPKLSNSVPDRSRYPQWHARHEQSRHMPTVIERLTHEYNCQFKFVIASWDDLREVESYLQGNRSIQRDDVHLMPEGTDVDRLNAIAAWLAPHCAREGFTFCPRRHIEWFGHTRAT